MDQMEHAGHALIDAARRGDQDAFRSLYQQHAPGIFRVLRSFGVRSSDIDDVVQDVFITAFSKIDTFGGDKRFFAWLCGSAVNVSKRHLSRTYWRTVLTDLVKHEPMVTVPPSPDASAERTERAARVGAVLDRIGDKKRTVLVLRDVMEFDEQETADALGIPRGTVATRLYHARRDFERIAKKLHLDPAASGAAHD